MSSIRDKYKNEAKQNRAGYIRLSPDLKLDVKADASGEAMFVYYDKEKKENVAIKKPVEGILVGRCMQCSWFDATLGSNGGNWETAYFYTKNKVILFKPGSSGYEKVMEGQFEEIETYLRSRGVNANGKKTQVVFVKIRGASGPMLVAVRTNLSIAITQLNSIDADRPFDYFVTLTPKVYRDGDIAFGKKTTQATKNLMKTNPPKYASISFDKPMNDIDFESLGAEESIETFKKWVSEQSPAQPSGDAQQQSAQVQSSGPGYSGPSDSQFDNFAPPVNDEPEPDFGDGSDDLPF